MRTSGGDDVSTQSRAPARRPQMLRRRLAAFAILAPVMASTYGWISGYTGSELISSLGSLMFALPLLIGLRCQLDPCLSRR